MEPLLRRYSAPRLEMRGHVFDWGARTFVMGVINATPDSFSGDGLGSDVRAAADLARRFEREGADIIDVGAESSRPGARELDVAEELVRLIPVVAAVREATTLPISVDTYHEAVAEAALDAGADLLNDIHGLRRGRGMASLAARRRVPVVAMHNQRGRAFRGTVASIREGFAETLTAADEAGLPRGLLILDPGFGFGWTPAQNLEMVRELPGFWDFELPLLLGPSRKSTIGFVLGTEPGDRLEGTAAVAALAVAGGCDIVRVHDVREIARVVRMSDAVVRDNWRPEVSP